MSSGHRFQKWFQLRRETVKIAWTDFESVGFGYWCNIRLFANLKPLGKQKQKSFFSCPSLLTCLTEFLAEHCMKSCHLMLVLESFPLGGGAFQPSQHSKIQSLIFLKGNSLKLNWDDVQFQVKWAARGCRWYWRWMPKWWAHSKRESTLRRTRWMASVTSFTRVAMSSKRAGTNVNTRAGYSSETSKTWQAGEVARTEAPAWWTCVFQVAPRASISPSRRIVRCTKHNWKLNASTMKYVNPPDSFSQDELGEFCLQPQLQSIEKQCSL